MAGSLLAVARFDRSASLVVPGPTLPCASLVKPLYVWASPLPASSSLLPPVLRVSDNAATSELVSRSGGLTTLLDALASRSGTRLLPAPSWGRVEVDALGAAAAFSTLCADDSGRAAQVRSLLTESFEGDALALRRAWSDLSGETGPVGVKCGWDLMGSRLLTHAALLGAGGGAVVLTGVELSKWERRRWEATLVRHGPLGLLPLHLAHSGPLLERGLSLAASAA